MPLKYLRYALGEIILVVIGILIALQINNADINRQDRNSERQYMGAFLKDLDTDILNIGAAIEGNEKLLIGIDSLLAMMADPDAKDFSERKVFLYSIIYTYWFITVEFADVTLLQLKSSGDFQLIKDKEISSAIARYSGGLESCRKQYTSLDNYFHSLEATQKDLFNLSLGKKAYELIEHDNMNMLLPVSVFEELISEGDYLLKNDRALIGRYYNDLLFYRTTLSNLNTAINEQKEMALTLRALIGDHYNIPVAS